MLELVIVRSRLAVDSGQMVLGSAPIEPSIVTLSAPFSLIIAPVMVPDKVAVVEGLIVSENGPPLPHEVV